ncbi:MAG TPA: amino acid adenylation domain-containing protein, partial [Thermoanaerobaculia bacterium]|nr:amino acid adenylation domain-containing protein [Thermoanaerobaculia bacterium]
MKSARFEDVYELSPMQQGILFHTLYDPVSDLYFEQCVVTLRGKLDQEQFASAWQRVAARHSILRTSFHWEGLEKPVQVVHSEVEVPFQSFDWSDLAGEVQRSRLDAFIREDRQKSFELTSAPLFRVALFRRGEDLSDCLLSFQHIVLDRWSRFLVLKEVFAEYALLLRGSRAPLPAALPYGDYIGWIQAQERADTEAFWRRSLAGFRSPTSFPRDASANAIESAGFHEAALALSPKASSELQSFARRHRLTMNTIVQGAWALLASRYSGEEDVLFGSTVSGRPASLPDVESMIGLFINSLPVRVRVPPDEGVLPWLQRLQTSLLELREYEHSSLIDIQGWSDVPRGAPLFESLVVFENVGGDSGSLATSDSLEVLRIRSLGGATNYPLTLLAMPGTALSLKLVADSKLFSGPAVSRMLGHLGVVLEGIVADLERTLSQIPLLTEAEQTQLLVDWNRTERPSRHHQTAHGLFEAQAKRTPDAIAVEFAGERLTYGDLDVWTNRLGHRLRALGVGRDVPVGICVERSMEMVVGVLGVLKAGGMCLPLDPGYPMARLQLILEDAAPPVILTDTVSHKLSSQFPAVYRLLHVDRKELDQENDNLPSDDPCSADLAYLLYTSGSSGRPKGVAMGHRPLVNLICWQVARFGSAASARTLQFSSLNFDVSFQEIFSTLCSGGTLVLVAEDLRLDPEALLGFLGAERVERIFLPFVALQQLAEAGSRGAPIPRRLREVITAGEQLRITPEIVELFERLESCSLENQYGPTETHVVTAFPLSGLPRDWPPLPPIGRPIDNARVYLLDGHRRPVPIGVVGELSVAGLPLARGYWNSPQMTAERFVADPFDCDAGSRLYRTGDLARYQEDGNIDYLGRRDDQVKIRGFRVELGEIEATLEKDPSVQTAVVVAREDPSGSRRLVAYVVPAPGADPTAQQLRRFLERSLPQYMLPSDFVSLDAFPMTPSGKVDRLALPAPSRQRSVPENLAPRTPVEKGVAEIWKEILNIDRVSVTDNFFELGGHSLLATRVA